MKKKLIAAALLLPTLAFATPAENSGTASVVVDLDLTKELNTLEDYVHYRKGRGGDSGVRAMDFRPHVYSNENLINKTYKKNIVKNITKPGVRVGEVCVHWKNCLKATYKNTNGYGRIAMKYSTENPYQNGEFSTENPKKSWRAKTRGNYRGRYNQLDGDRNGRYKVLHWELEQ